MVRSSVTRLTFNCLHELFIAHNYQFVSPDIPGSSYTSHLCQDFYWHEEMWR